MTRCALWCRDWAVRNEALTVMRELVHLLGKSITPELPTIMSHAWRFCEAAVPVYQQCAVEEGELPDSTPDGVTFSVVIEQLMEFLLTLSGSKLAVHGQSPAAGLKAVLGKLVMHIISFMQVQRSTVCSLRPVHGLAC